MDVSLQALIILYATSFLMGRYMEHLWSLVKNVFSFTLCLGLMSVLLVWLHPELKDQLTGPLWTQVRKFTWNSTLLASL